MRLSRIITTLLFLTTANYAAADTIDPRYDSSCGYLNKKIYCFGGATGDGVKLSEQILNTLDILAYNGSTSAELDLRWSTITVNSENLLIQRRDSPQTAQLPDGNSMIISGGWSNVSSNLITQTLLFNGRNQTWRAYSNYTVAPYGNRQIYEASSVYVPGYGVAYYGGEENNYNKNYVNNDLNLTAYEDNIYNNIRYLGYTSLTFFDINRAVGDQWYTIPQTSKPVKMPFYHKAVFDSVNNRILFVGGSYFDTATGTIQRYTFDSAITFNFKTSEWGTQVLSGNLPVPRVGHSLTLIGANQRHALLYGGYSDNSLGIEAVSDYCYTLDLDANQWTLQNTLTSNNTAMRRFQHSTIPISNDTIFIVFGKDGSNQANLNTIMLNVTNPSAISVLQRFVAPADTPTTVIIPGPGSTQTIANSSGLSTGATAGIAVGATAAGLLAIGSIIFFIFKKKKDKKRRIRELEELEIQKNQQMEEPVMEVNWDELEKYSEIPTDAPAGHFPNSPQLSEDNTTVIGNNMSPPATSPMLIHAGKETQRPNAVDETGQIQRPDAIEEPDRVQRPDAIDHDLNRVHTLQKPDSA